MISAELAEQLAWNLTARDPRSKPTPALAFLVDRDRIFVARHSSLMLKEPRSAVTRLIQGIYELEPKQARRIVRNRIYSTASPSEMCLGMVKVAAKRATFEVLPRDQGIKNELIVIKVPAPNYPQPLEITDSRANSERTDEEWMKVATELAKQTRRTEILYQSDRPVAALLVSAQGELLFQSLNTNASNRTLHAELNLVQGYFDQTRKPLPPGSSIFVSLKPCKMCAAMLWYSAEDIRTNRVFFAEDDPGPCAHQTVLDTGSFERARACRTEDERRLKVQFHLPPAAGDASTISPDV